MTSTRGGRQAGSLQHRIPIQTQIILDHAIRHLPRHLSLGHLAGRQLLQGKPTAIDAAGILRMVGIILQLEGVEIQRGVVFFDLSEVDHFAGEGVVVVLIINDNNDGSDLIVVMMVEVRWWIDIRSQRGINFLPPCNPPLLVPLFCSLPPLPPLQKLRTTQSPRWTC